MTIRLLTTGEMDNPEITKAREAFNREIDNILGPKFIHDDAHGDLSNVATPKYKTYGDGTYCDAKGMPEAGNFDIGEYDKYIEANVSLQRGDVMVRGKMVNRRQDTNGKLIGQGIPNPVSDTRMYDVLFPDGLT